MSIDVPDWQRQVTVNTDIVLPAKIDLAVQSLTKVETSPDYNYDKFTGQGKAYTNIVLSADETKSVYIHTGSGLGIGLYFNTNNPKIKVQLYIDDVRVMNVASEGIWKQFFGERSIGIYSTRVIVWDEVNDDYYLQINQTHLYKFAGKFEVKVHNEDTSSATVIRIDISWLNYI